MNVSIVSKEAGVVGAYRNGEVGVEKSLEVERLVALVADVQHGLQTVLGQSDAVL